jgi:ABC-type Zn uptake system ZnuABC Zn-binding protein ZnuA
MKLTLLIMLCVLVGCTTTPTGETVMSPGAVDTIDVIAGVAEPLGATAASLAFLWPPAKRHHTLSTNSKRLIQMRGAS